MTYEVVGEQDVPIVFMPVTVAEEVMQNVRMIITTMKYTVPMDRDFGIDGAVVDRPINIAKAHISSEIFRAVKKHEPRAEIESIAFAGDATGRLVPSVVVRINA